MNNSDVINKLEKAIAAWEKTSKEFRPLLKEHIWDLINISGYAASLGCVQICDKLKINTPKGDPNVQSLP